MKVVVGLGNPGERYENTRHNAGWMVMGRLAQKIEDLGFMIQEQRDWKESKKGRLLYRWLEVGGEKIELIKPVTFMNESGKAVAYVRKKHPGLGLDDLFVAHDDLDITMGEYKIQMGRGPKEHGGVESVERSLGTKEFWRVRVGVDSRGEARSTKHETRNKFQILNLLNSKRRRIPGRKYVLMKLKREERAILDRVVDQVVEDLVDRLVGSG